MYLKWRQSQFKMRRKSSSAYSNSLYHASCGGDKGYMPIETDGDTIISSVEDITRSLVESKEAKRRLVSRKKLIQILNKRFQLAAHILQMQLKKKEDKNRLSRTNSIPLTCERF